MNDTLKVAGRIGAELGAAKAELEKLRGLLHGAHDTIRNLAEDLDEEEFQVTIDQLAEIELALGQQQTGPECEWPTCECALEPERRKQCDTSTADTYTAVDMATAAAQGFRDGQAAVEQAAAQDERDPIEKAAFDARLRRDFEARWPVPKGVTWGAGVGDYCVSEFASGIALSYPDMWMAYKAGAARGKA